MHIKTNVELSSVQLAILAVCPLITVVSGVSECLYFMAGTILCLLVSQLLCWLFNKYMGTAVKIFVCAITSSFVVVMGSFLMRKFFDITLAEDIYFVIFSSVVMSADFIYFRHKATTNHTVFNFLKAIFIFALVLFTFAFVKEFLAFGTMFDKQLFAYSGFGFFETIASDLLILGLLCFLYDILFRWVDKQVENKNIKYQKYIKTIRDEKSFQYDNLRRQKLLVNEIEINNMNAKEAEKIIQKNSENEAINSVQEVLNDGQNDDEEAENIEETENEKRRKGKKVSSDDTNKGGKS